MQKLDISSSVLRKENETLHFNMVKVSVASTRTPWLNQHLHLVPAMWPSTYQTPVHTILEIGILFWFSCEWKTTQLPRCLLGNRSCKLSYCQTLPPHKWVPIIKKIKRCYCLDKQIDNGQFSKNLRIQLFDTFCETKEIISQRPWTTEF